MQFVSRIAGKTAPISVERQHGKYIVELGGVRHEVDTRALGPWVLSLLVEGQSHEVAVVGLGDGNYAVDWRGRSFAVELVDPLTHLAESARGEGGKQGKKTIKAYMPGRVVEVRVQAGDRVEAGQPLVVLEAMKMEHRICAPTDGTIRALKVAVGEQVANGAVLIEIDE